MHHFARRTARLLPLAFGLLLSAAPAQATVVTGTFSGVITSGTAYGSFGFANQTNLTGKAITGSFTYDLGAASSSCQSLAWIACFKLPGALTITQTIDGHDEIFSAAPPPPGSPWYNMGDGAVAHSIVDHEVFSLGVYSSIGLPSDHFRLARTRLDVTIPSGATISTDTPDAMPVWSGGVGGGFSLPLHLSDFLTAANQTRIEIISGGNPTRETLFEYSVSQFTIAPVAAPVPEPGSWALMIGGFGTAGAAMRHRRRAKPLRTARA